jgi:hypothetical protein
MKGELGQPNQNVDASQPGMLLAAGQAVKSMTESLDFDSQSFDFDSESFDVDVKGRSFDHLKSELLH